jgi:mono/diheme cytochrome c family protein
MLRSATLAAMLFLTVPASAEEGLYTDAQADKGHTAYNNYCAQCHRPDLKGALGPALIGDKFQASWGGKKVGDYYTYQHTKMPAANPGSTPAEVDWQITAYILKRNGYPAGAKDIGPDSADQVIAKK